jgi:hypothetical protein
MRVFLLSTPYPLAENPIPSLSLTYLATTLQKEGIEVQIRDGANELSDLAQRMSAKNDTPLDVLVNKKLIKQKSSGNKMAWQWT